MPTQALAANLDPANLIGNVAVPRSLQPTLRGDVRRSNPDGISAVPYFAGVSGQKLDLEYTDSALVVQTVTITFTGDSYSTILTNIGAADATNIESLDTDGFVTIRNRNSGDKHYLKILPQALPSQEAADLLGFVVDPYPGSVSYAGEIESAPPTRSQSNPQGTALLSRDEDLKTDSINRAFVSVLQSLDRVRWDMEKDVLVPHEVFVTTTLHPVTLVRGFFLDDPTIRLPINLSTSVTGVVAGSPLDSFFDLSSTNSTDNEQLFDSSTGTKLSVLRVHHSNTGTALDTNNPLSTWPTPDGRVVHSPSSVGLEKHASIAIDSIRGNVLYCPGATFVTNLVQKNDPLFIDGATNTSPFSHNGTFAVLEVLDEEHVSVRPLGVEEAANLGAFVSTQPTPSELNPTGTGFGTAVIWAGLFVPCSQMFFTLSYDPGNAVTLRLRMMVGKPLRKTFVSTAQSFRGHAGSIMKALLDHINDPTDAHDSTAISGFLSSTTWKDSSTINGSNLRTTIENILTDLGSSTSTGDSGAYRIGAPAVSTTGANQQLSLTAGSDGSQLLELLTKIRDHQIDTKYHDSTGYVSGLTLGTYVFPNLPLNSGVIVAQYLGETKVYNVSATSFSLVGNQLYYIYVDLTDGVAKITTTASVAFSSTTFPLYYLFTQGFGITWTQDLKRGISSNYKKGFVTVGGTGSDFTQLEAALTWIQNSRQYGDARTWEVLVQGDVTMVTSASVNFPVIIRGVSADGSSVIGGPKAIVRTKDGSTAFSAGFDVDIRVQFRDLYFKMSTSVNNTKFLDNSTVGDDWVFSNCVFDGGCFQSGAQLITNWAAGTAMKGWLFDHCTFKNASCASGTNYYMKLGFNLDNVTIRKCRFSGNTANANLGGIFFDVSHDNTVEDCYFDLGGKHVIFTDSQPSYVGGYGNVVRNNRSYNSRGIVYDSNSTKGSITFEGNWIMNCCVANGPAIQLFAASGVVASGLIARNNRVIDWQNGSAISLAGGLTTRMRVEGNIFRTSSTYTAANVGISVSSQQDFSFILNNEIDLSYGATSGNGKPGGIGISCAIQSAGGSRFSGNLLLNCGSTATPGYGIIPQGSAIVEGNIFSNLRGQAIYDTFGGCVIHGNNLLTGGSSASDGGIIMAGSTSVAVGNRMQSGGASAPPIASLPVSGSNQVMANYVNVAGPTPTGPGLRGSFIRKRVFANIGSKTVAANTTVVHAAIPLPASGYGIHYFEHVALPGKSTNLQAGIRVTYDDGTTTQAFNSTASAFAYRTDDENAAGDFATCGFFDLDNDKAIAKVEIVVTNPSGSQVTESLGQYRYYGFVLS